MNRTKFKISIFALAIVFIASVVSFFAINLNNFRSANAAGTVSVNGSSVFTALNDASVVADKQAVTDLDDEGNPKLDDDGNEKMVDKYYTMFTFGRPQNAAADVPSVSFRRNLAYNWWEQHTETIKGEADEEGEESKDIEKITGVKGLFNMEIGFKNTDFEKFVITFESQQYSKTEDGKTVNYILFFPEEGSTNFVRVLVTDDKDADYQDALEDNSIPVARDHIYIKFTEKLDGAYKVAICNYANVEDAGEDVVIGEMKNVGGNYAKYSSSSTTPVYPLIFNAEFTEKEEGKENKEVVQMVLYCLNNQVFEVKGAVEENGVYVRGTVTDDTPAVLCLNKEISSLEIGGNISFDYQLIDVLRSSPSGTLYYYVLEFDKVGSETDFNYIDTAERKSTKDDKEPDDLFKQVESDILLDSDKGDYLPSLYNKETDEVNDGGKAFGDNFKVDMAVKVFAEVKDTTSNGEITYIFLDWYLREDLKLTIDGYDFIAVGDNLDGVTYSYDNEDNNGWDTSDEGVIAQYQKRVTEAAKNLSAGSSSYFYLPSAESLFADDATAYTDLKISIYYYSSSQSSNTSLASNNLSINVSKPGSYRFTLYATDTDGNDMYYYDGKEFVKFKASEIWSIYADEDKHDYLPWFEFKVDYKGVEFKDTPGKQSTAYVGVNYSGASFEINGVANSYDVKYRLFTFDRSRFFEDFGIAFSYEQFLKDMDALYMDEYFEGKITRSYFREIKEVNESDYDYEEFVDYEWSSSGTSFTPQDANTFYYMRAEVTDNEYNTDPVTCSLAIVASIEGQELKGENEWLQNNLASVILLSVAGASLIAIILLIVIKPKNKEDIDVQFEKMNEKKSVKKSK